jgi:hypothetical protein
MIFLASDCLLFRLANGESVPLRPEMIRIEVTGESAPMFDGEFVNHVAAAVFHYFKQDLGRDSVTLAEFSEALEDVLRGFAVSGAAAGTGGLSPTSGVLESDLVLLAQEAGGSELFFFPRLRSELRSHLNHSPRLLRFHGLRCCVKQLSGARRWSPRCQSMEDHIVDYLRGCLAAERHDHACSLVVE